MGAVTTTSSLQRPPTRRFISLRTKLVGFISLIIITICSGLSWYFISRQEHSLRQALLDKGTMLGTNLAYNCRYALFTEDQLFLNRLIDGALQMPDVVYVAFIGPEGKPIAANSKGIATNDEFHSRTTSTSLYADPYIATTLLGGTGADPVFTSFVTAGGEKLIDIAVPILRREPPAPAIRAPTLDSLDVTAPGAEGKGEGSAKVYGVVQVGMSDAQVTFALRSTVREILKIAALVMLGGIAVTIVLARRIINPLRTLMSAARRITLGDLTAASTADTDDEVGQLSTIFNQMTQSLRERDRDIAVHIDTITALTQTLEQRVEERTHALQEANRQLATASRHKSEFLSVMSHELRTPLDAILGFCGLVMDHCKDLLPHRQYANLEKISLSAERLLTLINQLLNLSKIEAGHMEVQPSSFVLSDLVQECLQTVEPIVKNPRVQLRVHCAPDVTPIFTDREKVRQILLNLLSNAIKFTDHGQITVHTTWQAQKVTIAVTDTGIGIAAEALEQVFEAFRQLDSGAMRRYPGTGLGLSISRQLARLCGGELTAESTVGVGTIFTATIPVYYSASHERCIVDSSENPDCG
ncbi:MAG: sensor histidine kinase [Candidatus Binatia bacterium]